MHYSCEDCEVPIEVEYDVCPECGGTSVVTVAEIIHPEFRE